MNEGYAVVVPCLVFFFLDIVVMLNNRKHMVKENRRNAFEYIAAAVTVMQGASAIGYMDEYGIISIKNGILFSVLTIMFVSMALAFMFWFRYLAYSISSDNIKSVKLKIVYVLPAAAMIIFCVISPVTHWLFYVGEDGSYHRGTFFALQIILPYLYIIMAIFMGVVQYKKDYLTVYKRLVKYSGIFILSAHFGAFLQYFVYEGGYTQIGISFGLIVMYFELYVNEIMQNYSQIQNITKLNNKLGVQNKIIAEAGLGIWGIRFEEGKAPGMTADKTMLELLGIEEELSEEEVYAFWYERIVPEALPTVDASVKEMLEGSFSENTYEWIHPTKGKIYVRCGGTITLKDKTSVVLGGYHSDVDKIVKKDKLQAQELEEAKRAAEAASSAKTAFLSNMSHDIRTPMNAVLGYAELIGINKDNPGKIDEYLAKIQQSGAYLLDIINNILEVSRIDSGKATIDECFTDLLDKSNNVMPLLAEDMKRKGIKYEADMDIQHRYVFADMIKIRQINMNLFSNAIKYTPEGGTIYMYFKEEPGSKPGYAKYVNVISDTGVGMSEEYISHIFDSFSRERNTTQSKISGTGLGMSIVKKLVDLMGGTIEIESAPGKGTTFTVSIEHRIIDEPEKYIEKQLNRENSHIDLSGRRILLVEDNDLNAEIAMELLGRTGALLTRAVDGIECVDIIDKTDAGFFDVILMDVQMPQLNGYDATCRIRAMEDELKANIPIIAMTADAFDEDKKAAYAAGMNGHIAKPIRVDLLVETLSEVLGIIRI